jgi:hypothetical protein
VPPWKHCLERIQTSLQRARTPRNGEWSTNWTTHHRPRSTILADKGTDNADDNYDDEVGVAYEAQRLVHRAQEEQAVIRDQIAFLSDQLKSMNMSGGTPPPTPFVAPSRRAPPPT